MVEAYYKDKKMPISMHQCLRLSLFQTRAPGGGGTMAIETTEGGGGGVEEVEVEWRKLRWSGGS